MGHAHGVHIHILDKVDVGNIKFLVQGPSRFRPEAVPVYSPELYFLSVDIDTVSPYNPDSAETKPFSCLMNNAFVIFKPDLNLVKIWKLRVPGTDIVKFGAECYLFLVAGNICGENIPCFITFHGNYLCFHSSCSPDITGVDINIEGSVCPCINGSA